MKSQIIKICDELKEALLAEYDASVMEVESKIAKKKTHYNVLKAKDALADINIL